MLTKEEVDSKLYEFYLKADIYLPPDYRHRYIKFVWKHPTQTAIHIRDVIQGKEHLRRLLLKYRPHHVYFSTTTWLDPTTIRGRKHFNVPLHSDLIFDIDSDRILDARNHTLRLLDYLRDMGYRDFTIVFTGHKGFQVWVNDFKYDRYPGDPKERLHYFEKVKKKIMEEIYDQGILIDTTLWDAFRVVRLPNTIHATTMLQARIITEQELKNGTWIQPQKVYPDKPLKERQLVTAMSITSHVLGTPDKHVIFIDIDYKMDPDQLVDIFMDAQERFKLPDIYVFETTKGYEAICPKAAPIKHVLKVKKYVGDDPQHEDFMRAKGYDIMRISAKVSDKGEILEPPPSYMGTIHSQVRTQVSKGHLTFINRLGIPLSRAIRECEMVGSDEVKIVGAYSIR